jgi:hypothetical protein
MGPPKSAARKRVVSGCGTIAAMSSGPQLLYAERPVAPGSRIVVRVPDGHGMLGTEPLAAGDGFTVVVVTGDEGAGRWRTVLVSCETGTEGVTLTLETEGRYS